MGCPGVQALYKVFQKSISVGRFASQSGSFPEKGVISPVVLYFAFAFRDRNWFFNGLLQRLMDLIWIHFLYTPFLKKWDTCK
jgi:hypothetical protein